MSEMHEIIKMDQFSFAYEGSNEYSLQNINLTVRQGEFLVLTGASGCGKTTLTRCFNGLIPDFFEGEISGSCLVHGMEISSHETSDYAAMVGSVFQDPRSQFFTLHVNTEIPFPSENLGMPMGEIQKNFQQAVEELEISNLLGKSIFHLSSGEKQKVAIASVKTAGVFTYVLDEPSANLDCEGTVQLQKVLAALKAKGHTIIVSEHKLHYLKDLADRVLVLKAGQIDGSISGSEFRIKPPSWFSGNSLRQINHGSIISAPYAIAAREDGKKLRAEDLAFCYPGSKLLWNSASFLCGSGDIVGVVGKNGVGKSTLIRVLMGLEKPKSGKVYINEQYASKQKRQKQSFYVMQDVDYQLFAPTVLEEMLSGRDGTDADERKAKAILGDFGLGDYLNVHPSQLSGGQKQRLAIALALISRTPFIFLDEPTSGLDADNMRKTQSAIRQLAESGCCIFVITHDYEFAVNTFTSLLVLKEGTIAHFDSGTYQSDLLQQYFTF